MSVIKSVERTVQLARNEVYNEMTEATKMYAAEIQEKFQEKESEEVLSYYFVGNLVGDMFREPEKYGENAAEQVAQWLNLEGGHTLLYAYAQFADRFEYDFVRDTMQQQTSNGRTLTISHWLELARVEKDTTRMKLVDKAIDNNLSVRDLQQEIRGNKLGNTAANRQGSTGRKMKVPKSPVAATQRLGKMAATFRNFESTYSTQILDEMEELDESKLDQSTLDAFNEALVSISELQLSVNDLAENLSTEIERQIKVTGLKPKAKKKKAIAGSKGRSKR